MSLFTVQTVQIYRETARNALRIGVQAFQKNKFIKNYLKICSYRHNSLSHFLFILYIISL